MHRLLPIIVCLLVPTVADAQVGRLLDRARAAVATARGTPPPDAASPAAVDGRAAPAIDATRLLATRYWPQRGQFAFGTPGDHLLFPPPGLDHYATDHGEYVLRDAGGRVIVRQPIGSLEPTGSAAFLRVGTTGEALWRGPLSAGAYTLDVVFRGHVAGRVPFTVEVRQGDDPFAPTTVYHRDGPWRTLGYFEHETERRGYHLTFNAWISAADLGASAGRVEAVLSRDGRMVARSSDRHGHVDTGGEWGFVALRLDTPESRGRPNPTFFTIDDVSPGRYTLTLHRLGESTPFRTFDASGGADGFAPHPRSAADYEPRHSYLAPRRMGGSAIATAFAVNWADARP